MFRETDFIEGLKLRFGSGDLPVGIGDDGAVLHSIQQPVVVTDMLLDGRHFDLRSCTPELAGRKSVAVNLSDLAAMGCRPVAAFVSIAVSTTGGDARSFLERFYDGIGDLATEYEFSIAGGDTTAWDGPFAVNVCLIGTPVCNSPVLRSGACDGDQLYVTGPLGGSLESGHHLTFVPRLNESRWLAETNCVTSMMDISDGLSLDLHRLCQASGVGATLIAGQIPVSDRVDSEKSAEQRLLHALEDGEDFELLFTVPPTSVADLKRAPFTVHHIGEMCQAGGICLSRNGATENLPMTGWRSF